MRSGRRLVIGLAVAALVSVACGGSWLDPELAARLEPASTTSTPISTPTPTPPTIAPPGPEGDAELVSTACPMDLDPAWTGRVTCSRLVVPMDRQDPGAGTVEVAVAVIASTAAEPAPDPVLYLHGGPGGAALLDTEAWLDPEFALLARRDLVLVDHRGAGWSEPSLNCHELEGTVTDEAAAHRTCRTRLVESGVDLDDFRTSSVVADLEDLRRALGIDRWNLYGVSYGTRVALSLARDHPGGIRSLVLDSAYPPEVEAYEEQAASGAAAIDAVLDACGSDAACADRFPDLAGQLDSVLDELEAEPRTTTVTDPITGQSVSELVTAESFASSLFLGLYATWTLEAIPLAIETAADGDLGTALDLLAGADGFAVRPRRHFQTDEEYAALADSEGLHWTTECAEEAPFNSLDAAIERVGDDRLGTLLLADVTWALEVCDLWQVTPAGPIEDEPVVSDRPALVLAGAFDPITPPSWGRLTADRLTRSVYVEFPGAGHGPSFDTGCAERLVADFVEDPDASLDTACVARSGPRWLTG